MSSAIDQAIRDSQQAFLCSVWPQVASRIGGGKIVPVEAVSDKEFLDQYAGIDHWHVLDSHQLIRGIASRCQWPLYKHFQTFTVRIGRKAPGQTELAKRLYAKEHADQGWLRPYLFIQAYFEPPKPQNERLLYAGVAKLDDILTIITTGVKGKRPNEGEWWEDVTSPRWGNEDANVFAVVPFASVQTRGMKFLLVNGNHPQAA